MKLSGIQKFVPLGPPTTSLTPPVSPTETAREDSDRTDLSTPPGQAARKSGGSPAKSPKPTSKKAVPAGEPGLGESSQRRLGAREAGPRTLMMDGLKHLPGSDLLEGNSSPMNWKPLIRELLYPVQFDNQPVEGLDRVLQQVVNDPDNSTDHAGYLEAIQTALESKEPLGTLAGMPHPEDSVRRYLEQVHARLSAP